MYKRTGIYTSSDYQPKNDRVKEIGEGAFKQAEIRNIIRKPIKSDDSLKRLCIYCLHGTTNFVSFELDSKRRIQHTVLLPLCFQHALHLYGYLGDSLGHREYAYRVVALPLMDSSEETMKNTIRILRRIRFLSIYKNTLYLICHNYDLYTPLEDEP